MIKTVIIAITTLALTRMLIMIRMRVTKVDPIPGVTPTTAVREKTKTFRNRMH